LRYDISGLININQITHGYIGGLKGVHLKHVIHKNNGCVGVSWLDKGNKLT
jgi:hypothetical protein